MHNKINPTGAAVVTVADDTAVVSGIVDMQGYDSLEFLIAAGTLADADATFAVTIEEGDDSGLSDAAPVTDGDLIGSESDAAFTFADDGASRKVGYKGNARYVRCTVTPSNNTGSAPIAIIPLQGNPNNGPTDNPPA